MQTAALTKILRDRLDPDAIVQVRRPGTVFQLNLPAFLGDGDGVSIYLKPRGNGGAFDLTDLGMTTMRMSYGRVLGEALTRELAAVAGTHGFRLDESTGEIWTTLSLTDILPGLLGMVQIQSMAQALLPAVARRESERLSFRQQVFDLLLEVFADRVELAVNDDAFDPDSVSTVDAVVRCPSGRDVAILAVSSSFTAERAIGTRFLMDDALRHPKWAAVPRDVEQLSSRSRKRLLQTFHVLGPSFEAVTLKHKLLDLAA